jgi:fatty acid desaturase
MVRQSAISTVDGPRIANYDGPARLHEIDVIIATGLVPGHRFEPVPLGCTRTLRDETDAQRYRRRTFVLTIALYAVLGAALADLVPPWVLVAAVPWVYVRLSLGLHELLHVHAAAQVPAFHRLAMIFDTPIGLGYREHRAIHLRHHRYGGGPRDPERTQIEGSHGRAFLMALTTPERALVHWVRTRGVDARLAQEASVRLVLFCALVAANPLVFAVYWVALRASIGGAGYVFHHLLHNRTGALGTFAAPFPAALVRAGRALFGVEPMLILLRHRSHHLWPDVRVRDLPPLPAAFALPEGPVAPATLADALRAVSAPPLPARRP